MTFPFDRNLFTQTGLDSGSLTMLGTVVHSFKEPGEYRGSVNGEKGQAVFYVSVDKDSPVAHADIDMAALVEPSDNEDGCAGSAKSQNHFTVNPKGYVLFRVSKGSGGYYVSLRKTEEKKEQSIFNSRRLAEGDLFAGTVIRPGTYSVVNEFTDAKAKLVVTYPQREKAAYRPAEPVRIQETRKGFEPQGIEILPGQGLVFECGTQSRIRIRLLEADDGPGSQEQGSARGWKKNVLPKK